MDTTTTASPALLYARIFGAVLTLAGILGFFVTTSQDAVEPLLGFDVNLTHNFVHLATGLLGLVAGFTAVLSARLYALVLGIVYTVLGIWGMTAGGDFDPFDVFVRINVADHVLHLAIGIAGLAAYVLSRDRTRQGV